MKLRQSGLRGKKGVDGDEMKALRARTSDDGTRSMSEKIFCRKRLSMTTYYRKWHDDFPTIDELDVLLAENAALFWFEEIWRSYRVQGETIAIVARMRRLASILIIVFAIRVSVRSRNCSTTTH